MKPFATAHYTSKSRFPKTKKVNFMVEADLFKELEILVPAGKRSEFVNEAIRQAMIDYSRRKAYELMLETRKIMPLKKDSKDIVTLLRKDRYGGGHSSDRLLLKKPKKK